MVADGVASEGEVELVTLFFSVLVDGMPPRVPCQRCGEKVMARIAAAPGIAEAGMHMVRAASERLGFYGVVAVHEDYDFYSPDHRKAAVFDLAEYWLDVVERMRTCGLGCERCVSAGSAWRSVVRLH